MQKEGTSGTAEYFSQRNLHPRTGDIAAFSGRLSHQSISPRAAFHTDVWTTGSSFHDPVDDEPVPASGDVELEGVTPDGGFALNVDISHHERSDNACGPATHDNLLPVEDQALGQQVPLCSFCKISCVPSTHIAGVAKLSTVHVCAHENVMSSACVLVRVPPHTLRHIL